MELLRNVKSYLLELDEEYKGDEDLEDETFEVISRAQPEITKGESFLVRNLPSPNNNNTHIKLC